MRWPKKAPKWLIDLWRWEIAYAPNLIYYKAFNEAGKIKIGDVVE